MSRISDILVRVRDTLNDPLKERWSDAVLLRILNDGQLDIAKQAELFKGTSVIQLVKGQAVYELPEDLLSLQRAVYKNYKIDIVSTRFMDDLGRYGNSYDCNRSNQYYSNNQLSGTRNSWRQDTTEGDILYLIFDYDAEHQLRTYPRPFADDLSTAWSVSSAFGTTDSFDDSEPGAVYGILDTIATEDDHSVSAALSGVAADGGIGDTITVRYVKAPEDINIVTDNLSVPKAYDTALKYWTAGQALRNDLDVQNRKFGAEELTFYNRELEDLQAIATTDNVSAPHFRSTYRGMG